MWVQFPLSLIFSDSNNPFLLLILKWGGELTELGRQQAQELGKRFRCMYPGSRDDTSGAQGAEFVVPFSSRSLSLALKSS